MLDQCGVAEHPSDCLCDVDLVAHPVPTGWVTSVDDMWMGREICSLLGLELPLDEDGLVKLLEAMTYAKDRWDPSLLETDPTLVMVIDDPSCHNPTAKWGRIRHEVKRMLSKRPQPLLLEVLENLNVSVEEFVGAVTSYSKVITLEQLMTLEHATVDQMCHNGYELMRLTGISSFKTADNLHSYWGIPYKEKGNLYGSTPISTRTKELLAQGLHERQVCAMILEEFGTSIKEVSVYKTKLRMRKAGLI
jgi:hypothetical protein